MTNNHKHKTWWDEKAEIIIHQVSGPYNEQDAEECLKKITEIKLRFHGKKLRAFLNLSGANQITAKARKIIAKEIYQDPDLIKIAGFGLSTFARVVNNFMITAGGA